MKNNFIRPKNWSCPLTVLKPARKPTVQGEDYHNIIMNTIKEGYKGKELANTIIERINQYDRLIARRIQEFDDCINYRVDADNSEDDEREERNNKETEGKEDYNGLEVFFNP